MNYRLSARVLDGFPNLDFLLADTKRAACKLDSNLDVSDLWIEARRHQTSTSYGGWAYPSTRTTVNGRVISHRDGRIRMDIGDACTDIDVVMLFAHELRHISQFQTGRRRYGYLTVSPLSDAEAERDAEAFENVVLEWVG